MNAIQCQAVWIARPLGLLPHRASIWRARSRYWLDQIRAGTSTIIIHDVNHISGLHHIRVMQLRLFTAGFIHKTAESVYRTWYVRT